MCLSINSQSKVYIKKYIKIMMHSGYNAKTGKRQSWLFYTIYYNAQLSVTKLQSFVLGKIIGSGTRFWHC